jgi:hypothetical protein
VSSRLLIVLVVVLVLEKAVTSPKIHLFRALSVGDCLHISCKTRG